MLARKNNSEIKNDTSMMPKDVTEKILGYVDLEEAHRFSFSSKHLFFTLNHDKYLEKRIDFGLKFKTIIEKALVGIDTYLKHDSDPPYECQGIDARSSEYMSFPKGYRRAEWLNGNKVKTYVKVSLFVKKLDLNVYEVIYDLQSLFDVVASASLLYLH